jgi:hypothetical protein
MEGGGGGGSYQHCLYMRGFNCIFLKNFNGNQTENDNDIHIMAKEGKRISFLLSAKWLKMYEFFCAFAFKIGKMCFYYPKNICLIKNQYEYQETHNFMLVSNFLVSAFKIKHKKCYAKKP